MHALEETVPVWWRPRPFDSMVLVGWAAGPRAQELSRAAQSLSAASLALASRERTFGVKALGPKLGAWKVNDWGADPVARGGYMAIPRGLLHAGTVNGALATCERAAKQWLEAC